MTLNLLDPFIAYKIGQTYNDNKIGNTNISAPGAINAGLTLAGGIAGQFDYNKRKRLAEEMIQRQKDNEYVNVPYDPTYQSGMLDNRPTSSFEHGGLVSKLGYKDNSPFKEAAYLDIESPYITMNGVSKPLYGKSNTGDVKIMYPNNNYSFEGTEVREIPFYEDGGEIEDEPSYLDDDYQYSENQAGYESPEDYLTNTPDDYESLYFYGQSLNDSQEDVSFDPIFQELMNFKPNEERVMEGQSSQLPIQSYLDKFNSMGIQIGSINTGVHNKNSKHYSGSAFDIPASKNGGKEGLRKLLPIIRQQYPELRVIDEIDVPAGKIGDGNHIHVELK